MVWYRWKEDVEEVGRGPCVRVSALKRGFISMMREGKMNGVVDDGFVLNIDKGKREK